MQNEETHFCDSPIVKTNTASKVQEFFFTFMTAGRHGQTKSEETDV